MKNILEMLERSVQSNGSRIAISDINDELTYSDLLEQAKRIGTALSKNNCKNQAVAVLIPKSVSMLAGFLGVMYSGNFYVPIDSEMPVDRMLIILDTIQPQRIIVTELTAGINLETYNDKKALLGDMLEEEINEVLLAQIRKQTIDMDPAYALFTSGSTGIPKGVIVCHRSVIDYAGWCKRTFDLTEKTVLGNQTPFYFSMSVLDIYATLACGGQLVIIPKIYFSFPADLIEYLDGNKINTIYWVPSALCIVSKSGILSEMQPKYLQKILFAGEVMPTRQLNVWRKFLPDALYANLFGPTEITDIGIYYILNRELADDEPIPIGKTCDNVDAFILDENQNKVLEPGKVGELYFRGSYLAYGYYQNWEKTKEVFVQNPLNTCYPEIVYKTGDMVKYNEYGEMVYVSRRDFQIKHMGCRIELGEIETYANAEKAIDISAVIFDDEKDEIVMFYEGDGSEQSILTYMQGKLPRYMVPNKIIRVKRLPLNENGKIDKKTLSMQWKKERK